MNRHTWNIATVTLIVGFTGFGAAEATIYDRGNGLIYDDDLDVTWMQYVSTAEDTGYCVDYLPNCTDGLMTKDEANAFVNWFNTSYNPPWGYDWRLPITPTTTDLSCSDSFNEGFSCTQSELGHLYYLELGNLAGEGGLVNRGSFVDIQTQMNYWSDWDFVSPGAPNESMTFKFRTGLQTRAENTEKHYVWLVHDGDVAPQTDCNDGVDNDGDGNTDLDDAGCQNAGDNDESDDVVIRLRHLQLEYIPANLAIWELVREGMPWCPPGFPGCPGNRLSIHDADAVFPPYMSDIGRSIWKVIHASAEPNSFAGAASQLQKAITGVPVGTHFTEEIKAELLRLIAGKMNRGTSPASNGFLTTEVFVKSLNAIELDWRVPEARAHKVKKAKHVGVDFSGMVWVGLRDIEKSGQIKLIVRSNYKAFPLDREFSSSWPFLTYDVEFDGQLGKTGHLDLKFYTKPLRFQVNPSGVRVLRIDKDGLVDVTTGAEVSKGIIWARSDRPGSFILVGKDK